MAYDDFLGELLEKFENRCVDGDVYEKIENYVYDKDEDRFLKEKKKMDMKKQFMDEVEKIENDKLKKAAKKIAKDLPDYFWHVAASSSGKSI